MNTEADCSVTPEASPVWLAKVVRIEWLGQTVASLCWIASVFAYGLSSTGDYLQLSAASAWLLANIAVVMTASGRKSSRQRRQESTDSSSYELGVTVTQDLAEASA